MVPQSGPSLLPVVAAAPQQRAVELVCYGDTGVQVAQESAHPPTAHGVAGCNPFDVPPQTGPRVDLYFEGMQSCGEEGTQGTPGGGGILLYCMYVHIHLFPYAYTFIKTTEKMHAHMCKPLFAA